ncbi:PRC-barrel domain-containing protein [Synechococcus sp. MU1625]|uniref:PRC-barrel domain-containing protein n=1 Tax=Synechococcus sp. MU1625 TaxID=2508347 RepID=UPI00351D7B31
MTPTPSPTEAITTGVPSDRLWLRSELMGTQVITRDTGRRLGVVGEVIVDIDRREVVAVGLRDNPLTRFLPGLPRWMPLDRIRQVGDVILVDSADSLSENFNPERYSRVINCQVITESGDQLGRVLGFAFDIETGELTTLVMGALGVPLLGEGVLSTWEMPVEEIVSSGPDRIIVYEGAEDKLKQLNSGVLEKLGVGGPSWEEQERERYRVNLVPVENQLTSGQPQEQEQRRLQASDAERLDADAELEYVELEDRRQEAMQQRRYLDEPQRYDERRYEERPRYDERDNVRNDRSTERARSYEQQQPPAYDERGPYEEQPAYQEEPAYQEQPPRRAMPASRRAVQQSGEPLDVEPMEDSAPQRGTQDLDDPW